MLPPRLTLFACLLLHLLAVTPTVLSLKCYKCRGLHCADEPGEEGECFPGEYCLKVVSPKNDVYSTPDMVARDCGNDYGREIIPASGCQFFERVGARRMRCRCETSLCNGGMWEMATLEDAPPHDIPVNDTGAGTAAGLAPWGGHVILGAAALAMWTLL